MAFSAALPAMLATAAMVASPAEPDLAAFEANLAAHASATEALTRWCAARGIAANQPIRAQLVRDRDARPPVALRRLLALSRSTPVGYRHVLLACGETVLSEAHNWFVPGRLTPEMNRQLAETDTPFGKVAAALAYRRHPLATLRGRATGCPAGTVSSHRALLTLPDGTPLALVLECYTGANLGR